MAVVKIEFAVEMTCFDCADRVRKCLSGVEGIRGFDILLRNQIVLVETSLPAEKVLEILETTGCEAAVVGCGGLKHKGAAVAMLRNPCTYAPMGLIRFFQIDNESCIIEGTVDGLYPGLHGIHVNESGDISGGCESVGDHYNPYNTVHGGPNDSAENRHVGDLGNVAANADRRATFRFTDKLLKVWDIIGRAVVVTESEDDLGKGGTEASLKNGNSGRRLASGVIARAAGIFENPKKICSCDGTSIWDEKDRSQAGPSHSNHNN